VNKPYRYLIAAAIGLAAGLAACSPATVAPPPGPPPAISSSPTPPPESPAGPSTPTPTPAPPEPQLLTICLGAEPRSLFPYFDRSRAASSVREAIYDGPYDVYGYDYHPVILAERPSFENQGIALETVEVQPGDALVNAQGSPDVLQEGTIYLPSGCSSLDCARVFAGGEPAQMERLVVRFRLLPGLAWSDGTPLTAADSLYAFSTAESLYPAFRPDLIRSTHSYQAINETTLEWRGLPGYRTPRPYTHFFNPLPRHAWSHLSAAELASADLSSRSPIGWGPYILEEWIQGDHITLRKNPLYFRSAEGLPRFDRLVYRFVSGNAEAVQALAAGECDIADSTTLLDPQDGSLGQLIQAGKTNVFPQAGGAWEQLLFGISPADPAQTSIFQQTAVRQAAAMCIDRELLASSLFSGTAPALNSYVPARHPLYNPQFEAPAYDPAGAKKLLEDSGWVEAGSPASPRQAQGVPGITNGEPLAFTYLTSTEPHRQQAARIIRESLEACGFGVELVVLDIQDLLAGGPDGPVFGRQFEAVQFGWMAAVEPPCALYLSREIPGPYPEYPSGWGGANAAGFRSPEFDAACLAALASFEEAEAYREAHSTAQEIFSAQLPALPLYQHVEFLAARPGLCGLGPGFAVFSPLWNLESVSAGADCP
jgi:peptide/nickel transport system substrate-binding protein